MSLFMRYVEPNLKAAGRCLSRMVREMAAERERYEYLKSKLEGTAMPHSPEPWRFEELYRSSDEGETYLEVRDDENCVLSDEEIEFKEADIRRIVACVNFLRGVPTEHIEKLLDSGFALRMEADQPVVEFYEA